ncbi:MAG: RNA polymerase sigma-54 factor [Alphaproteobacteria bacterium]|nr:MAG: RNA polymerase sigma-54 factor [Alphaproteobacteria bacterium]
MALGQKLQLRQSTQLVMTPQLRQAIRLLQMSNLELSAFLAEEIERNPFLELAGGPREVARPEREAPAPERLEDRLREAAPGRAEAGLDVPRGALYDEAVSDSQAAWRGTRQRDTAAATIGPDALDALSPPPVLREHLLEQLGMMPAEPLTAALARLLVDELEEDGYLREGNAELAARYGVDEARVEAAVALLQRCEPTGVGARDLAECLALQLAERDRLDPAMQALLDHLPLLAAARFAELAAITGMGREDLAEMVEEIRALDPRPGLAFSDSAARAVVPDILLREGPDGDWLIELNPDTMPRLLINRSYAARVGAGDAAAQGFVANCNAGANWLKRALDQRANTILKVATSIVRRQSAFFRDGISGLQPLALRDVAEEVGVHESTVSRVTSGKYLSCPRGVFELRFFFSTALAGNDGTGAKSATAIKDRIRRLIEAEDPARPLSDDTLVARLREDGVEIARRTVAKYREALKIPSSTRRKRRHAGLAAK